MSQSPSVVERARGAARERWRQSVPGIAGVLVVAICLNLGAWQLRRAAYKDRLQARADAAEQAAPQVPADVTTLQAGERVRLTGHWRSEHGVLIDNRSYRKQPGYYLQMPLQLADGSEVIVLRGWLRAALDRKQPEWQTPAGEQIVEGITQDPADSQGYTLGELDPHSTLWPRQDMAAWRTRLAGGTGEVKLALVPVAQTSTAQDGLVRDWHHADYAADKHRAYALQWFSMAAVAAGLVAVWLWRRTRRAAGGNAGDDS
ncbi:SURF1 family protein [Uliginosibacterium sp. H1]|uniref:SURF1 family protein n=1 Tax=Uliginosibacterium sp. H1 TaxID=3114757 RepID=UPI002E17121A|nr:SURF1 family protein [Uliginosibacterium sp. H1]